MAEKMTNLVWMQEDSLVVSLDGDWGTGKTFLLKRWQADLEKEGFKSIYFNAWEDDFCDDPLVAIIGQISNAFTGSKSEEIVAKIKESAGPLLIQGILGVIRATTGIAISADILEKHTDSVLEKYSSQIKQKKELKQHLQRLSEEVMNDTGQPLVFIIDELDRCRPTFAIELLERVKHIFDVPGIVFVFGINQKELCSSIKSVYGEIDAGVYLRRFFDISLSLPDANAVDFCKYLINDKYELNKLFSELSETARKSISNILADTHSNEFRTFSNDFLAFYNHLGLSLRDIDSCIRSMFFVAKNIHEGHYMYPYLIGALIALRLKNLPLYQEFLKGKLLGSEVMDYIDEQIPDIRRDEELNRVLILIEIGLYRTSDKALHMAYLMSLGESPNQLEYLSKRTRQDPRRLTMFLSDNRNQYEYSPKISIPDICSLIELTQAE